MATQCRSNGLCSHECEGAIQNLVNTVQGSYHSKNLPVPDSVQTAINAITDFCADPFLGFPHRIDVTLDGLQCVDVESTADDYIIRLAQVLGVAPSDLLITDCSDIVTRGSGADVTLGSTSEPNDASPSSCDAVSLTCTKLSTTGDTSSASNIIVSGFMGVIVALFFF